MSKQMKEDCVPATDLAEANYQSALQQRITTARQEVLELQRQVAYQEQSTTLPLPALKELQLTADELFTLLCTLRSNEAFHLSSAQNNKIGQAYLTNETDLIHLCAKNNPNHNVQQQILELKQQMVQAWNDRLTATASLIHAQTVEQAVQQTTASSSSPSAQQLDMEKNKLMIEVQQLTTTCVSRLTTALSSLPSNEEIQMLSSTSSSQETKEMYQFILDVQHAEHLQSQLTATSASLGLDKPPSDAQALLEKQHERLSLFENEVKSELERYEYHVKQPLADIQQWCAKKNQEVQVRQNSLLERKEGRPKKETMKKKSRTKQTSGKKSRRGRESSRTESTNFSSIPFLNCLFFRHPLVSVSIPPKTKKIALQGRTNENTTATTVDHGHASGEGKDSDQTMLPELKPMLEKVNEWKTTTTQTTQKREEILLKMEERLATIQADQARLMQDSGIVLHGSGNNECDANRPTDLKSLAVLRKLIARKKRQETRYILMHGSRPSYSSCSSTTTTASTTASTSTTVGLSKSRDSSSRARKVPQKKKTPNSTKRTKKTGQVTNKDFL
jgi:hypothetical protein